MGQWKIIWAKKIFSVEACHWEDITTSWPECRTWAIVGSLPSLLSLEYIFHRPFPQQDLVEEHSLEVIWTEYVTQTLLGPLYQLLRFQAAEGEIYFEWPLKISLLCKFLWLLNSLPDNWGGLPLFLVSPYPPWEGGGAVWDAQPHIINKYQFHIYCRATYERDNNESFRENMRKYHYFFEAGNLKKVHKNVKH